MFIFKNMDNPTKLELATRFKPIVFLHSEETYFPCSIEYLLKHSSLYVKDKLIKSSVDQKDLSVYDSPDAFVSIDMNYLSGQQFELNTVPVYASVHEMKDGYIGIQYSFLYTYNGPDKIFKCLPDCINSNYAGQHLYDLEEITVFVEKDTMTIKSIYYGAHTTKDGMWVSPGDGQEGDLDKNELMIYDSTHPRVFSARYSHGTYPSNKTWMRILGFADDLCNQGFTWNPTVSLLDDTQGNFWNIWKGSFEKYQDGDPPSRHEWNISNFDTLADFQERFPSTNFWKRMFCCC